ncbi:MAG: putative SOS response-associated peptidase YedK [Enterobacterales bacterium]|jgi:putative SOS response-associated peptidase YedK
MCGRFSVNKEQVESWVLDNWNVSFECETNHDLRPTQSVSTIIKCNESLTQLNTTWGIKPSWSKKLLINAQGETADTKKTFKDAFIHRRCLIPCSAWYEWRSEAGKSKQKYSFNAINEEPLLMAGIWYESEGIPQMLTLTTHPNERCGKIHKRMPVLIDKENVDYWFNSETPELGTLIEPVTSESIAVTVC